MYDITYMWNLKNKLVNITKQKQTDRHREETSSYLWQGGNTGSWSPDGLEKANVYKPFLFFRCA